MLLHCMSEAMKRDGDLKLAAVSPQAATVLELTRADRLFEIYETSTDAVRSFTCFLPNAMRQNASLTFPLPISSASSRADTYTPEGDNLAA